MQLTRAADYAVRVMIHLAKLPPGGWMRLSDLAVAADVPLSFVAKVLQRLGHAGLVASRRGMRGGFALTEVGRGATLLEVVETIEGPLRVNLCVGESSGCLRQSSCAAHQVWLDAQRALMTVLNSASVAELAALEVRAAAAQQS
ncbi:MAG: Rrf2 family transcriptional regulator [Acidobacteriales bacterium]|nr:Rrf2 family transcriptional regulator [Terriglobales bacterium]